MTSSELLAVGAIYFGCLVATCIVCTVVYDLFTAVYDLLAIRWGWRTVSNEVLRLGTGRVWLMLVATALFAFALGCLFGHLFMPQWVATETTCGWNWDSAAFVCHEK